MSATPPPSRPRLVRPDEPSAPPLHAAAPAPPHRSRAWLPILAVVAALVAAGGWGLAARRATTLEARVGELESAVAAVRAELAGARSEIAAREQHLDALRDAAADVETRIAALRALAERGPAPAAAAPGLEGAPGAE